MFAASILLDLFCCCNCVATTARTVVTSIAATTAATAAATATATTATASAKSCTGAALFRARFPHQNNVSINWWLNNDHSPKQYGRDAVEKHFSDSNTGDSPEDALHEQSDSPNRKSKLIEENFRLAPLSFFLLISSFRRNWISDNMLSCELPSEIWNLINLKVLEMSDCSLLGWLGRAICTSFILWIRLNNQFSGEFPSREILNVECLKNMRLGGNQFSSDEILDLSERMTRL
ncbi:hypothetical protein BJ741DRAFT_700237 [Chytriomyces cf. hyalinus JEL632]|nr:hypothetical protein BJ741DRAFT_700237 [Chytriomyces cf. hyalinus JEL632]